MTGLENIDDDLDKLDVIMVKMASKEDNLDSQFVSVSKTPAIIFFDEKTPLIFEGN